VLGANQVQPVEQYVRSAAIIETPSVSQTGLRVRNRCNAGVNDLLGPRLDGALHRLRRDGRTSEIADRVLVDPAQVEPAVASHRAERPLALLARQSGRTGRVIACDGGGRT
jgi:hypothetical protein